MPRVQSFTFSSVAPEYRLIKKLTYKNQECILTAQNKRTKEQVLIKRTRRNNLSVSREHEMVKMIENYENILEIKGVFFTKNFDRKIIENLVFQFADHNLKNLIDQAFKEKSLLPEITVKNYIYQLLGGVEEIHKRNITHRDLKPSNIFLSDQGKIKIGGFQHSKILSENGRNTPNIGLREYRAPQVLLCMSKYTKAIDIWAIGCIMAELFLLQPFFKGYSEGNQLFQILKCLGSFTAEERKQIQSRIPFDKGILRSMTSYQQKNLNQIFRMVKDKRNFLDLITKMLQYLPQRRITAKQALQHPFFNDVRKIEEDIENKHD